MKNNNIYHYLLGLGLIINTFSAYAYFDDFSTDTTSNYTVEYPSGDLTTQFIYDAGNQRAQILTEDNVNLQFSDALSPASSGDFSLDFLPTILYPAGGQIIITLKQDETNYYQFTSTDGYAPGSVIKVVNGVTVDSQNLTQGYTQGVNYSINFAISPQLTTVEAFGQIISISTDTTDISVNSFTIYLAQQDAYIDNIAFADQPPQPPANQDPTVANDTALTEQNSAVNIPVLNNDTDSDGSINASSVLISSNASNGTTVVEANGTVTYTPDTGFIGSDAFDYTVEDNDGAVSNAATVNVTVTDPGSPPADSFYDDFSSDTTGDYSVEHPFGNLSGVFLYDTANQRTQVLTGDNVDLQFSQNVTSVSSGYFSLDFLPTTKYPAGGRITITLKQDATTYYQFTSTDGYESGSVIKVVNGVTVDSQNLAQGFSQNTNYPIIFQIDPQQTTVEAFGQIISISTDTTDISVNSFTIYLGQQDAYIDNIAFADQPPQPPANQDPTAANDTAITEQDIAVNIPVLNNDSDSDGSINASSVLISSNASNGTTVVEANGTVTYTPDTGFIGSDAFDYTVEDNEGAVSNVATVNVTVTDPSIPPTALFFDDFSTSTIANYTIDHTWTKGGTGQFLYDSANERTNVRTGDNVGLAISQSLSFQTTSGSFSMDFLPIKKYPAGGEIIIKLLQDVDNYYQLYSSDGYSAGSFSKIVNGVTVDVTNLSQGFLQNTNYPIIIEVSPELTTLEAFGQSIFFDSDATPISINSFSIQIRQQDAYIDNIAFGDQQPQPPTNQAPVALDDSSSTQVDSPVTVSVLDNDTDSDGTIIPSTVSITGSPLNGLTNVLADGRITFTPDAGFTGNDSFTYIVEDDDGAMSNEAVVDILVTDTPPPPSGADFSDDFSTNTIANYTVDHTWTKGGTGQFLYDSANERTNVRTGDNVGLAISQNLPFQTTSGSFRMDFLPIKKYPAGGIISIKLIQDVDNYYELYSTDGYSAGSMSKVVNGVTADVTNLSQGFVQNNNYPIVIEVSPQLTTLYAFGQTIFIDSDTTPISINSFSITATQQDAYYDDIRFTLGAISQVVITQPESNILQTVTDLTVKAVATGLDSGWGVKFVLDQGTVNVASIIDTAAPYEVEFALVSLGEHTVDAYVVDENSIEINQQDAHDQKTNVGIGDYLIALGDSITRGSGDDILPDNISLDGRNSGGGYEPILNNLLTAEKGYPNYVANEGVSGAVSADGVSRIISVLAAHPDAQAVLVQYGTNDAKIGGNDTSPLASGLGLNSGDPGYNGSYKSNMQEIINHINSASKVVMLAKVPYALGGNGGTVNYPNPDAGALNITIQEYNLVIDELINIPGNIITIVPPDFYNHFRNNQSQFFDNLHPNGTGYNSMAELWKDKLITGGF